VEAGIDVGRQPRLKKRPRGFICEVCFDDDPNKETVSLSCNHRFCRDCYVQYLEQKIKCAPCPCRTLTLSLPGVIGRD
jgi:ariadne-1